MTQAVSQKFSFDQFIEWYPDHSEHRYKLRKGVIVEMPKSRGKHSQIAGFLSLELGISIRSAKSPCFLPRESIVRSADGESGYEPDVIVLDRVAIRFTIPEGIASEPLWDRESIITIRGICAVDSGGGQRQLAR